MKLSFMRDGKNKPLESLIKSKKNYWKKDFDILKDAGQKVGDFLKGISEKYQILF